MLQQLLELPMRVVAAIAGIAVVTTGLQQSLELLLRAQGCSKCWPCRSKALRQKLISAVSEALQQKLDSAVSNDTAEAGYYR